MSEGSKKLKYPSLRPTADPKPDDENTIAFLQLRVLTTYMISEFLDLSPDEITGLFQKFGVEDSLPKMRELYDYVIESINRTPNAKKGKMNLEKAVNIFNAYSGITPEKRAFETASGVKVFKAIGEFHDDGEYRDYPTLKPAPSSPTIQTPFPPTGGLPDTRGFVSPTSPAPEDNGPLQWPTYKIPSNDGLRVADARVGPPPNQRTSPASGSGLSEGDRRWGKGAKGKSTSDGPMPEHNIAFPAPIQNDAPDVTLNIMDKQVRIPSS